MVQDEDAADAHLQAMGWPSGLFCPHRGAVEGIPSLVGDIHCVGLCQCNACRQHFRLMIGTLKRSHVPLLSWVPDFHLIAASKIGRLGPPAPSYAERHLQSGLVHGPPHPRGDDECEAGKAETPTPSAQRQGSPPLKRDLYK